MRSLAESKVSRDYSLQRHSIYTLPACSRRCDLMVVRNRDQVHQMQADIRRILRRVGAGMVMVDRHVWTVPTRWASEGFHLSFVIRLRGSRVREDRWNYQTQKWRAVTYDVAEYLDLVKQRWQPEHAVYPQLSLVRG